MDDMIMETSSAKAVTEADEESNPFARPTPAASRPVNEASLMRHGLHSVASRRYLARLRYQLSLGLLLAALAPSLFYNIETPALLWNSPNAVNTLVGSVFALILSLYLYRRAVSFPGIGIVGHVLPATSAAYGLVVTAFFLLRFDYSGVTFTASFVAATAFFFIVSSYLRHSKSQRFYVVPSQRTRAIASVSNIDWVLLERPQLPPERDCVIIADLRADLGGEWERLVADAALAGIPVFHVKQVTESLTGRVEIEHLSENSFGSLIPNSSYTSIKRGMDLVTAVIALPFLLIPFILVAIAIKLESPGPVFFRQERRGYRGRSFRVVKFRTMSHRIVAEEDAKQAAITRTSDSRITRVGQFLRRSRIDELPQIWNIIRGEMSWIGPRPEAMALSEWYLSELPFYSYRHIVRPGITGWAQVNQGHVADLDAVFEKLHYDFYYIKNFSAWLDMLIVGKTAWTIFSGHGAK
jgi:lipopolysaccharide/colanic/teichoic acid biosynthesis glycosyltransferase